MKRADVEQKLAAKKPFVWLKRQVSPVEAEQIQALRMDGIGMSLEPTRYYPQGGMAGQLLGFVNRDSEGLEGIELQYNDYIRGAAGSSVSERDALGRRVLVEGVEGLHVPPGSDVHLTLGFADPAFGGKGTGSDDSKIPCQGRGRDRCRSCYRRNLGVG